MLSALRSSTSIALVLGLCTVATTSEAQTPPIICGPDCTHPGRYVLCNDSFDSTIQTAGGVQLIQFLDTVCSTFAAPAPTFQLTGFTVLAGGGDMIVSLLWIRGESGMAVPGPAIYELGVAIPSAAMLQFSGLYFAPQTLTDQFRICLRQQIDDPSGMFAIRPIMYDTDGFQGLNHTRVLGQGWQDGSFGPATGDFILRAVVEYADLTPWAPGGVCDAAPPDAGVADSGPALDSGPRDTGGPPVDSGPNPPTDAGVTDADPIDMGFDDAGLPIDGGVVPTPGPTITAISPREGSNVSSTEVTVTGTGFVSGLSLKIGSIPADRPMVAGASTILAVVPANILAGTYDVVVQNPDGQSAVLANGYTVVSKDQGGAGQVADGCGCRGVAGGSGGPAWAVGVVLLALLRRRQ